MYNPQYLNPNIYLKAYFTSLLEPRITAVLVQTTILLLLLTITASVLAFHRLPLSILSGTHLVAFIICSLLTPINPPAIAALLTETWILGVGLKYIGWGLARLAATKDTEMKAWVLVGLGIVSWMVLEMGPVCEDGRALCDF